MSYGDSYSGHYYDDISWQILLRDRVLMFTRSADQLSIASAKGARVDSFIWTCRAIVDSFDIDRASGDRLDRIGTYLDVERGLSSDDRYRSLIKIRAQSVLQSASTTNNLLEILALYTEQDEVRIYDVPPMHWVASTVGLAVSDAEELVQLMRLATAAAYSGTIIYGDTSTAIRGSYVPGSSSGASGFGSYGSDFFGAGTGSYGAEI